MSNTALLIQLLADGLPPVLQWLTQAKSYATVVNKANSEGRDVTKDELLEATSTLQEHLDAAKKQLGMI